MTHEPDTPDHELPELAWALNALREPVPVTAAWRASLAEAIRDDGQDASAHVVHDGHSRRAVGDTGQPARHRRWSMSPVTAIAAGIMCVAVGALLPSLAGQFNGQPTAVIADRDALPVSTVANQDAPIDAANTVGVRFAVMAPGVQRVSLVGDFNQWDATATPLHRSRDGVTWTTLLPLAAGRHVYAFVIDGEVVADPTAPTSRDDDFGVPSSMLVVGSLP